MILSFSEEFSEGYINELKDWESLSSLGSVEGYQWCNHHLKGGHRSDEDTLEGFNMIVLDVDSGYPIEAVRSLFEGYKYLLYTTKRHTEDHPRFRLILPCSHVLYMNKLRYKEFMTSIISSMPFEVDEASKQRCKTWATNEGEIYEGDGELFNILPYIPRTKKEEERQSRIKNASKLEAWFLLQEDKGRNNLLYRYGCILLDGGCELIKTQAEVIKLNDKLREP